MYALVADDIKLLTTDVSADNYFTAVTIFCFFMFLIELLAASMGKPGYWLSFFFWLDLIATASIISDIEPLMTLILGEDSSGAAGADTITLARASRGARIGTRAGRMARVIRLIRLVRIVKLYKSANQAMVNQEGQQYQQKMSELEELKAMKANSGAGKGLKPNADGEIDFKAMLLSDQMESKVGKKLSEITTRRVIVLVLIMLFSQPVFSVSTYMQEPNSYDYGLNLI
jgi:hypothetical protein